MNTAPLDALLATPLLEGVDDELLDGIRTEASITAGEYEWAPGVARREGFVRFVTLQDGEEIVVQGALTTELIVVLEGTVVGVQARSGRPPSPPREHGPGTWFGEVSAHSHHPSLATYRARGPAVVAALEARLFAKLYAEDETFKERIDEGYQATLPLHLGASTLCRDLDDQALAELQAAAELRCFEEDDVVAEQGSAADEVFLVRAGAIALTAENGRVLAFYKGNATFGEHALLAEDATWPATATALMRTAVVALPRAAFARLPQPMQPGLLQAANRLIGRDDVDAANAAARDERPRNLVDELFVMVERESVKGGRALVIDRQACVRCNMCVESCVAVHDDKVPRLSKVGTPVATDEVLVTACYHCETPQCMLSCDYAAIRRDPQGRIRFEYDNCVGCAGCIEGCPYGVIRLVEPFAAPPQPKPSFLQSLPLIGRLFGTVPPPPPPVELPPDDKGKPQKPKTAGAGGKLTPVNGKTIKCDLCAGLPFEACVYNCPTTAIVRREPQSLFARGMAPGGR